MRKLKIYVHVDGVRYGPDDVLPAAVVKKITNPDVWAEGADDDTTPAADQTPEPAGETPDVDPNRPRGNASREDWATYAADMVEVTGQMSRDDIKAAVELHEAKLAAEQGS